MIETRRRLNEKEAYIPAQYQQVEYLESSKGCWIETNLIYEYGLKYEIDCYPTAMQVDGFAYGSNRASFGFEFYNGIWVWCNNTRNHSFVSNDLKRYIASVIYNVDSYVLYIDNERYEWKVNINIGNHPVYIGGFEKTSSFSFVGWIYNAKIYNGDIPVADFIPCYRKSDLVAGMYDRVNGVFYTSAGTVDFIAGPDVN